MVERKEYLDQLWAWKDEQQIKVVTGIRRCGKSVLLEQYQQRLLANGVTPEQIISINFENLDYEPLKDYMKLYNYLKERLCADKMTYIFLDEVQEVPSFEKVVDSLYIRDHVDVYITGSNAYMLSSELATLLSGRYTEIKMLPFSFREYMAVTGIRNHILPRKRYDLGFTIENIVYLELLRRGSKVNIGKYGSTEVDFVTQKEGVLTYYQVTADMTAEETFEREMRPLRSIQDNYEKIVLTLDRFSLGNYDGIKVVNVIDWLLG